MHRQYALLDTLGALCSMGSTVLYVFVNMFAWPVGIIAILINTTLYYQTGLFADAGLEIIYLVFMVYGWAQWHKPNTRQATLPIRWMPNRHGWWLIPLNLLAITLIATLLKSQLHSTVPWMDATTTCISITAQWMVCRKYIQHWILWFVVDALYIGLYLYKGIPMHALLMLIYLAIAVWGFCRWRKGMTANT